MRFINIKEKIEENNEHYYSLTEFMKSKAHLFCIVAEQVCKIMQVKRRKKTHLIGKIFRINFH